MSAKTENTIKLRDGRTLGYAEFGDPNGKPVLHFHGSPSSRYEGNNARSIEIATRLKARLIVVERPGFGLSDFKPGRTFADWPDDVVEFADALHLERFAVMGYSSGGPYSAACAWKIPQRLTRAGIVSGPSPLDAPGALHGINKTTRQSLSMARRVPWLLSLVYCLTALNLKHAPARAFTQLAKELSEPDGAVLAQADVRDVFVKSGIEAFRSGTRGITWDDVLITRPWGFQLQDIKTPVYLWQGEADYLVPPSQGRYLAKTIPNCQSKFYPNEGHFSLFITHCEEILSTIVG
jgi:pimeloyl-ACP methyl ester carboxylesterase